MLQFLSTQFIILIRFTHIELVTSILSNELTINIFEHLYTNQFEKKCASNYNAT